MEGEENQRVREKGRKRKEETEKLTHRKNERGMERTR